MEDIIWAIIKTRAVATESSCKCFFKARFLDIYRDNNHIVYYNFCQQYKDYFAIVKTIKPTCIFLQHFFSKIVSIFTGNSI